MLPLVLSLPADDGSVAIEYALIAALVSMLILAACLSIGQEISAEFLGPIASALNL